MGLLTDTYPFREISIGKHCNENFFFVRSDQKSFTDYFFFHSGSAGFKLLSGLALFERTGIVLMFVLHTP